MRLTHQKNSQVDISKPLTFSFNGRIYNGFSGDTLASALLANNFLTLSRSFKYGRKRGLVATGVEEPNALVSVESDGYYTPNLKATEVLLYDGLSAQSASKLTGIDVKALLKPLHRFMRAGFYYKTFIPQRYWAMVEHKLRAMAGFSKAPTHTDVEVYDHNNLHCEVLVIGGGIAGMSAALKLVQSAPKLRVILLDERAVLGGNILSDIVSNKVAEKHYQTLYQSLLTLADNNDNFKILTRTTAFAWHDENYIQVLENVSDHLSPSERSRLPRQILHHIRAQQVLLATGAHERPMLFENNDLSNIMLAQSVRRYAHEFNVLSGNDIVVYGNNNSMYQVAYDLSKYDNVNLSVIDVRAADGDYPLKKELNDNNVAVKRGYCIVKARGSSCLKGVEICAISHQDGDWQLNDNNEFLKCDLLAMAGGFDPVVHLDCHTGARPVFDKTMQCFIPSELRKDKNRSVCGSVIGWHHWQDAATDGGNKAVEILKQFDINADKEKYSQQSDLAISEFFTPLAIIERAKVFVDMQNDVTTQDIMLAIKEGYSNVEHIKRYTAMGFGTDQGKTGNVNGIAVAASCLNVSMAEIGTTTFRPAYTGVAFGALAGRMLDNLFDPQRLTMIHTSHINRGARFEIVGQWYRPWYYPQANEDIHAAVKRECLAVRHSLGVMDASTLGKIDIQGKDARQFLSRVYTNAWQQLAVGQCRYGLMCDEKGMIADDGVTACLADEHFLMTTTTGGAAGVYATLEMWLQTEWSDLAVQLTSVTDHFATVAVVGPNARKLMRLLCGDIDFNNDKFKFMQWRQGTVCGVQARVMRISFSGELAYEINVQANYGRYIWQQVFAYGKEWGITPYGTESMHVLRAEKGYIIVGQDTDGSVTPADANMSWILAKNKTFSYIGERSFSLPAITRINRKKLVGLTPKKSNDALPEGAHIIDEMGKSIGHITSSYFSPILNRPIALAMLKSGLTKMGDEVIVRLLKGKKKDIVCSVTNSVFYDVNGDKVDGND